MAISTDRVDLSKIADVAKSTYNKASDSEAIKAARSLAGMKPDKIKKSILDLSQKKIISSIGSETIGVTEPDCDALRKMQDGNLGAGNNRNLNSGVSLEDCATDSTLSSQLVDKTLSMIPALKIKNSPLNPAMEKKIDSLINNKVKQSLRAIGVNSTKPSCLLGNSKGSLANGMSNIGFTSMSKFKISDMLGGAGNCLDEVMDLLDGGLAMASIAFSGTINTLSRMGVEKTVDFANEIGVDAEMREQFFGGYKLAINGRDDKNVENKLLLLDTVKKNVTDENQKKRESIMTLGTTDATLKAVSTSTKTSNSPVSDYHYTTRALASMDPNWNKDNEGKINYSRLKDNKRMTELATSSAKSSNSESTDFSTGTVNKSVEDDMALNILLTQECKKETFTFA